MTTTPSGRHSFDVGVVIPVYNRAQTLIQTLPYVVEQTASPRQLVVVDDGSMDDSAQAADRWLSRERRPFPWQVIRAQHVGAAAARNLGLKALGATPYVAFLDSDDHWPADFLERTSGLLRENPAAAAASVDRRYVRDGAVVRVDDISALAQDPIQWMFFQGAGIASCTVVRRDVLTQVGGWPDYLEVAEDLKLFVELAQRGQWLHSPGAPVEFNFGAAAACGEEGNLSRRYAGAEWRWVCVYEQIYQQLCERNVPVDRGKLQDAIAMVWSHAGKNLLALGERGGARNCFVKSIRWKPGQFRTWKRLLVNAILPVRTTAMRRASLSKLAHSSGD